MATQADQIGLVGVGAVSGYGWGRKYLWDGLVSGESAAKRVTVGEISGLGALVPDGGNPEDSATLYGRALYASGREAIADAEGRGWRGGDRVGLLHCSSLGDVKGWRDLYFEHDGKPPSRRHYLQLLPSTAPSMFMAEYGFAGPSVNVSSACASANVAIILAQQWLSSGFATDVIVSATDLSITPENAYGFHALGAIGTEGRPQDACRPFQEGGQGFVAGEASVTFVLSKEPGARAYAHVLGGALTHDSFHPIAIKPDGLQVAAAYIDAIDAAGLTVEDIRYFNAHGTGTNLNDWTEATVVDRLFPETTEMYATKMLHGHCQGASAAIELAVVALSYEMGEIPAPKIAGKSAHPRLLDGVVSVEPGATLKSALGMGGYNSAVVLDRIQ